MRSVGGLCCGARAGGRRDNQAGSNRLVHVNHTVRAGNRPASPLSVKGVPRRVPRHMCNARTGSLRPRTDYPTSAPKQSLFFHSPTAAPFPAGVPVTGNIWRRNVAVSTRHPRRRPDRPQVRILVGSRGGRADIPSITRADRCRKPYADSLRRLEGKRGPTHAAVTASCSAGPPVAYACERRCGSGSATGVPCLDRRWPCRDLPPGCDSPVSACFQRTNESTKPFHSLGGRSGSSAESPSRGFSFVVMVSVSHDTES